MATSAASRPRVRAVNVASKPGEGRSRYQISCEELANFQAR
jgi:hypothetical protein